MKTWWQFVSELTVGVVDFVRKYLPTRAETNKAQKHRWIVRVEYTKAMEFQQQLRANHISSVVVSHAGNDLSTFVVFDAIPTALLHLVNDISEEKPIVRLC